MPKQAGIFKITGTMDDVSFFKTSDGYLVRKKTSVNAARIQTDPAFKRTRENLAEFARAAQSAGLLRNAVKTIFAVRTSAWEADLSVRCFACLRPITTAGANARWWAEMPPC
jgi:predicted peroxiredoxin